MAASLNSVAFRDWTGTGGTFTIPTTGTPKGVIVGIAQNTLTTDQITSVTWGGGTMTRITSGTCGGETGRTYLYFRGSSVASAGTVNVVSVAGTFTAWAAAVDAYQVDTELASFGTFHSDAVANPSVTLATTSSDFGLAFAVLFSGVNAPSGIVAGAGMGTIATGRDFGTQSAAAEQGAGGGANEIVDFTVAAASSAMCAALVREVPPVFPIVNAALAVA